MEKDPFVNFLSKRSESDFLLVFSPFNSDDMRKYLEFEILFKKGSSIALLTIWGTFLFPLFPLDESNQSIQTFTHISNSF